VKQDRRDEAYALLANIYNWMANVKQLRKPGDSLIWLPGHSAAWRPPSLSCDPRTQPPCGLPSSTARPAALEG
jgi:hypothetical protein